MSLAGSADAGLGWASAASAAMGILSLTSRLGCSGLQVPGMHVGWPGSTIFAYRARCRVSHATLPQHHHAVRCLFGSHPAHR